jgi:RNA polymerase sigma-70 factor (ECF subfamily)
MLPLFSFELLVRGVWFQKTLFFRSNEDGGPVVATCTSSATHANFPLPAADDNIDGAQDDVVKRAQAGDAYGFDILFRQHWPRVYSVCLRMTRDTAEAEDLTQEAFLQAFCKLGSFRGEAAFSTWLYRIAVNTVLMKFRRKSLSTVSLQSRISDDFVSAHFDIGTYDSNLSSVVDRVTLARAFQQIPVGYRTIFVLHELKGYKHHEIAKLLNCSLGNSKSQLHKAKRKLRALITLYVRPFIRSLPTTFNFPETNNKPAFDSERVRAVRDEFAPQVGASRLNNRK